MSKFIQECDTYWKLTGKAPKIAETAWFIVPDAVARRNAIGDLDSNASRQSRMAFSDSSLFKPIPEPLRFDWLSEHKEAGQTFDQFVQSCSSKINPEKVIYLQPLGRFVENQSPSLERLRQFTQAFFQVRTKVLKPIAMSDFKISSRINPNTNKRQFLSTDIENSLAERKPEDACAVLAVTMEDLTYRNPNGHWWNFLYGHADARRQVAVYSFARFNPEFFGRRRPLDLPALLLKRSCKTVAHETGHMFGIKHCIFYHCVMNGTNNMEESDNAPVHLCPVDLRKLHFALNFDTAKRYSQLRVFHQSVNDTEETRWLDKALDSIK